MRCSRSATMLLGPSTIESGTTVAGKPFLRY